MGSIGFIEFDIRHRLYKVIRQVLEICPRSPPKQDRSLVNGFKVQINRLSTGVPLLTEAYQSERLGASSGARIVSASAAVSGLDWKIRSPIKG